MEDVAGVFVGGVAIVALLIGLPWLILHYMTKWKQAPKITQEDENLLDEMYNLARRLEDRMNTVERIVAAYHPDFKPGLTGSAFDGRPGLASHQSSYPLDRRN